MNKNSKKKFKMEFQLRFNESKIFNISKNKLIISKYKFITPTIYSSGLSLFIIIFVSNMMNKQNINAPANDITLCNKVFWKITCMKPPKIRIHKAAKRPAPQLLKSRFDCKV